MNKKKSKSKLKDFCNDLEQLGVTEITMNTAGLGLAVADSLKEKGIEVNEKKESPFGVKDRVLDQANTRAIIKIDEEQTPIYQVGDIEYTIDKDIKIVEELGTERMFMMKDNKIWVVFSKELYDNSFKVIQTWFSQWDSTKMEKLKFLVPSEEHSPIIAYYENFGVLIAPRVESEEETN